MLQITITVHNYNYIQKLLKKGRIFSQKIALVFFFYSVTLSYPLYTNSFSLILSIYAFLGATITATPGAK